MIIRACFSARRDKRRIKYYICGSETIESTRKRETTASQQPGGRHRSLRARWDEVVSAATRLVRPRHVASVLLKRSRLRGDPLGPSSSCRKCPAEVRFGNMSCLGFGKKEWINMY